MQENFDPMAGESARRIREDPEREQPILDPTDPRYGQPRPTPPPPEPPPARDR